MPRQTVVDRSASMRHAPPPAPPSPDAPAPEVKGASTNGATSPGLTFTIVDRSEVPEPKGPHNGERKYKELEAALKALPAGKSAKLPIPADTTPKLFSTKVLSGIRKLVPHTRSRSDAAFLWLWIGEPIVRKKASK